MSECAVLRPAGAEVMQAADVWHRCALDQLHDRSAQHHHVLLLLCTYKVLPRQINAGETRTRDSRISSRRVLSNYYTLGAQTWDGRIEGAKKHALKLMLTLAEDVLKMGKREAPPHKNVQLIPHRPFKEQ